MRVISLNVNGLRSAERKGLSTWLAQQNADLVCIQEIKAQQTDIKESLQHIAGLQGYFAPAEKKGYSGVAIYSRHHPNTCQVGFGNAEFDREGRYLQLDFPDFSVISVYFPSGSSSPERQEAKYRFLKALYPHLNHLRETQREYIISGDWNIAHHNIDLKNWKSNQKNSGFLPEERAWLSKVIDELGFVDVFRQKDTRAEQYTWWSNRGQSWAKNVGWRIDYQVTTPKISKTATQVHIYREQRFSDHAPLIIDYTLP